MTCLKVPTVSRDLASSAVLLPQDLVLLRHLGMIVSRLLDADDADWGSKNLQPRCLRSVVSATS